MYSICLTSITEYSQHPDAKELEEALELIAKGDRDALIRFYESTKAAVYGFALSILKNVQDAEDVLQESYLRVYAAAESYKPNGKPMAWLFTITRNLALMKIRKQSRIADLPQEDWER